MSSSSPPSPPPPSAAQNIELETRKGMSHQAEGSNGSNGNRRQISGVKRKRSRTRKRNNINKLMPVELERSSAAPLKPEDEAVGGGGGSQTLILQTLGLSLQDRQRQQEQLPQLPESDNVCGRNNDQIDNDTEVRSNSGAAADHDNGDNDQCRHRRADSIEQLGTRAPHVTTSGSSPVASSSRQSRPVAHEDRTSETIGESESNKLDNKTTKPKTGGGHIAEDKNDQTRAQVASRLAPIVPQQATLVPASGPPQSTSKHPTASRARSGAQKRHLVPASIIGSKQQRSGCAMAETAVLVPVGELEDEDHEGGNGAELVGRVSLDRKLSQSSSGHESSSQLADFMTGSASAISTPILANSRRSSSYAVCVDIELNECASNKSNYGNDNNNNNNNNCTTQTSAAAMAATTVSAPTTSTASSIRRSWSATDCSFMGQLANGASSKLLANGHKLGRNNYKRLDNGPADRGLQSDFSGPPIKRSISRSMLDFDPCVNEKFLVYWKNLTFAYPPGLLTRLSSCSKSTCQYGGNSSSGSSSRNNKTTAPAAVAHENALVLNNVSGSIGSNQLVAIIGPSGCGKTTLLQFLAGNNGKQPERLRICGLGEPKVAFIGQDDSLLPGLTARETLVYASRLQNGAPNFDHAGHIEPILAELGLLECANRCVSKLSGGQAKRVTIAQELLYPTNLLILDEVTSGLDASTSYAIVKLLKYLVSDSAYPMSIVISIHQPSARLFSVFDKVYVMSAGSCLYEGSCNLAKINAHLARFNLQCPRYHNIADYLIELACLPAKSSSGADAGAASASGSDAVEPDSDEGVCEPFLQANGHGRAANNRQPKDAQHRNKSMVSQGFYSHSSDGQRQLVTSESVLDKMIGFQRKQSESSIEQLKRQVGEQAADTSVGRYLPATNGAASNGAGNCPTDASGKLNRLSPPPETTSLYSAIEQARQRRPKPFLDHFAVHFERSLARIRRSYILTYLQLVTYIILGVQLATFYGADIGQVSGCPRLPKNLMLWILASNSAEDSNTSDTDSGDMAHEIRRIQENMNFLLVTVMTATFAALEITVITFPMEAKTIKREWRNGWYRVSSYFMGRTLADLPFQLTFVLIFCLLIFAMTGQLGLTTWRFASFVLIIVMTALIAQSIGLMFGALFMNNLPAAVFTAPLAIFPTLLFSGFFSRVSQVSAFYRPLTYLSHFRYAFDALLVTLYGYDRCNCDQAALTSYHASMANQTSSMRDMFHLLFGASDCIGASAATTAPSPPPPPSQLADLLNSSAAPSDANTIADSSGGGGGAGGLISHEDLSAIRASNQSLASTLMSIIRTTTAMAAGTTTTMAPALSSTLMTDAAGGHGGAGSGASESYKQLEDTLVDTMFQQMSAPSGSGSLLANDTGGSAEIGEQTSVMDRLADKFATKLTTMLNRQSNFGHPMPTECKKFNSYLLTEFDLDDDNLLFSLSMLFVAVLFTRLLCNVILHFTIATRIR